MKWQLSGKWFNPYSSSNHSLYSSHQILVNEKSGHSIFLANKPKQLNVLNNLVSFTLDKISYSLDSPFIVANGLTYRFLNHLSKTDLSNIVSSYNSKSIFISAPQNSNIVVIGGNGNYAHYLFEYLPKIIFTATSIGTSSSTFILNDSAKKWKELTLTVFDLLGLGEPNLVYIDSNPVSLFSTHNPIFVESTHALGNHYFLDFNVLSLINKCASIVDQVNVKPLRLYLARESSATSWRNMINQDQIRNIFSSNGYKILYMSRYSQLEQIQLLSSASHITVEAGADSFATMFAPTGCQILELIPANFLNGFGPLTTHKVLDHKYYRIEGTLSKTNVGATSIDHDYTIPIEQVDNFLDL